jgi:peptidoglycan/LPS O-acetylase OafA/YrhL
VAAILVGQAIAAGHYGLPAAIVCGFITGVLVLAFGYGAVRIRHPAWLRLLIMGIFMIPAGYAAYLMTGNLLSAFHVRGVLNPILCSLMALVIACMAPIRLAREAPADDIGRGMGG